jgi:16S rRNA processing protein RimM
LVGFVRKTSGLKGEVVVQLDVDNPSRYSKPDTVFLDIDGTLTPFFITKTRLLNTSLTVTFEGVATIQAAENLVGLEVWLPLSALPQLDDTNFYFHEIPGFRVIDTIKGDIGAATDVVDRLQQPILRVGVGRNEILIPLAPGILERIDRSHRILYINAPEGLINLYLNPERDNIHDDFNPFNLESENEYD